MLAEDKELLARFLEDEPEAVQVIEQWIAQAARPFQRRLAVQWADARQEVRLAVLRALRGGAFRGEARLKTYIWRIVAHSCVSQLRAQTKWHWVDLDPDREPSPAGTPTPLQQLLAQEAEGQRWRLLHAMPPECRALWAMIVGGQSYRQMSQQLSVSEGALRVRARRCRQAALALRAEWEKQKK